MINYIVELTFLIYGLFLLSRAQYLTCLILLVLSLILVTKGFQYKISIIITIIVLLFITQYHVYFPYREQFINIEKGESIEGTESTESIEGFKTMAEKELDAKIKKDRKKEKKQKARLERELQRMYAGYPRRFIKNKMKLDTKSKNWGDSLGKWSLLKENLFMIFNMSS